MLKLLRYPMTLKCAICIPLRVCHSLPLSSTSLTSLIFSSLGRFTAINYSTFYFICFFSVPIGPCLLYTGPFVGSRPASLSRRACAVLTPPLTRLTTSPLPAGWLGSENRWRTPASGRRLSCSRRVLLRSGLVRAGPSTR